MDFLKIIRDKSITHKSITKEMQCSIDLNKEYSEILMIMSDSKQCISLCRWLKQSDYVKEMIDWQVIPVMLTK